MEPQRHQYGPLHEAAVVSVATYLREEGLDEPVARARASEVVREARESMVGRIEAPRSWWALALRGVLAIAAGAIFVARPVESLVTIVFVLGAWVFVDGVIALVSAITNRERSWSSVPAGAIGVIIGYLMLTRVGGAMIVFFVLTAAWALARGAAEIGVAVRMRRGEPGRISLAVLGIASFAFGILLLVAPAAGVVTLGWWIGVYAILYGAITLLRAFQVRHVSAEVRDLWTRRGAQPQPA